MSDNNNININTPDIGPYTQLKPFRFWCQKVLPLVYDESLSYYELLCKVVDYLNKTMEDVDQMITDMGEFKTADTEFKTEVRDAYIAFSREVSQAVEGLETFVNNYFNNLDVQQEINNKLDAMAAAGYFDELFTTLFASDIITEAGNVTSAWIAANLLQETGYVIDNSLTVANAAADAKATGDAIAPLNDIIAVSFTEYDGYFEANGNITSPSDTAQEKYTNRLSVKNGDTLKFAIAFPSSVNIWVSYVTYTENGDFIERVTIGNTTATHFEATVNITTGVGYIAFTYRTWGSSTTNIDYITSLYEVSAITKNVAVISEASSNLFNGTFSGLGNFEYVNGKLKNTATDTYSDFHFQVRIRNNSTNLDIKTVEVNFKGRVSITIKASGAGNNINILHIGRSTSFSAIIPLAITADQTYTISINVEDYDVQTVRGLIISDIQIVEGAKNIPYIPSISAIDYVARGYIDTNITEKNLNVLLMGDSIFGSDGEIALFLNNICNSCINGAFGGTRVSVRSDTTDNMQYFDGVNLITALCSQTWTDQDTAVASLSSSYRWITDRLTTLKAVDMSKIDLLIMDWGTNDYTGGATINDITTAYGQVIDLLQTTYPTLRVLVSTPIWRYWGTESDNINSDNRVYNVSTLKEIVSAIEQFMKDKRISVLNAYQNLPLSYKTASTYYDENDSTHLNTFGNNVYAHLLHGKIRSIY